MVVTAVRRQSERLVLCMHLSGSTYVCRAVLRGKIPRPTQGMLAEKCVEREKETTNPKSQHTQIVTRLEQSRHHKDRTETSRKGRSSQTLSISSNERIDFLPVTREKRMKSKYLSKPELRVHEL
jgi:hypothetical protein